LKDSIENRTVEYQTFKQFLSGLPIWNLNSKNHIDTTLSPTLSSMDLSARNSLQTNEIDFPIKNGTSEATQNIAIKTLQRQTSSHSIGNSSSPRMSRMLSFTKTDFVIHQESTLIDRIYYYCLEKTKVIFIPIFSFFF